MPNYKGTQRRLSEAERKSVRARYLRGERAESIAASLGSSPTNIWLVVRGLIANRNRQDYEDALVRFRGLSVADRHWIAGIVDGEGWIGIGRNKSFNGPRVSVGSVDDVMAPTLHRYMGGSLCIKKKPLGSRSRPTNCWDLYTLWAVMAFCEVIGPLLRVKRRQALALGAYCKSRLVNRSKRYTAKEQRFVGALHRLNRKGVRDE